MPIDVTMPKLSDTMEEGKILKWLKQVGDRVKIGEPLAEVETDKANMELEAFDEGVFAEVRVAEGQSAPVGAVIAVLTAPGEKSADKAGGAGAQASEPPAAERPAKPAPTPAAAKPAAESSGDAPAKPAPAAAKPAAPRPDAAREGWRPSVVRRPASPPPAEGDRPRASPLARRIATEHGLDLRALRGTGPGGRIVERDVTAALAGEEAPPEPAAPEPAATEPAPTPSAPPAAAPGASPGRRVALSRIRRTTARRMADAKREIPHFYASTEVAMDDAVRLKEALTGLGGEWDGLTYTHLVLKAVGVALTRVPELNASYEEDAMVLHETVHVGLATAVDDGLVVPVVRNCDREPLATIVRQVHGLLERARTGKFSADDLVGGTFTVSNLGMLPVSEFAAVINPPQAAILAVATIRETPVVRGDEIVPGHRMTVTLSCDHRIVDGMLAGRFLRELKTLLENPLALAV